MKDSDKSIDDWVATLAGRRPLEPREEWSVEAVAIRNVMRHHIGRLNARAAGTEARREDHSWQQLSFRLRKEGLLQRPGFGSAPRARQSTWFPLGAAAALAFGISVAIHHEGSSDSEAEFAVLRTEAPIYRGQNIVIVEAAGPKPLDRSRTIAVAMQALDARPVVYAQTRVVTLDMEVSADRVAEIRRALEKRGIDAGRIVAGLVRINFHE